MSRIDPWRPADVLAIDIGDYLSETMHFTAPQHGAYLLLMMECRVTGYLPADDRKLSAIARTSLRTWRKSVWPYLARFFRPDGKHLKHIDLDRLSNAGGRLSFDDWAKVRKVVFARDDFTCTYCGVKGGELECDHFIPVSRGGSNAFSNLTAACRGCNRNKGASVSAAWGNA